MTRASRPYLLLLLAAALFLRAFVPQGYMPERTDGGAIAVALCNSGGVHLIPLKDDDGPDGNQRAEQPCAFAGLAGPATTPPPSPEPTLPLPVEVAYADEPAFKASPVAERFLPPARGPPLSA